MPSELSCSMCKGRDSSERRFAGVGYGYLHEAGFEAFPEDFHYACANIVELRILERVSVA